MLNKHNKLDFYQQLGDALKEARIKSGQSQESLAEAMGLSRVTIVNIEKGRQKVQVHNLVEAANFLNVDVASLIPGQSKRVDLNSAVLDKIKKKFSDEFKASSVEDFVRTTFSNLK
ncbi:anaerobic benzoate catabolism transcriptional regulator [compost metagenome]